MGPVRPSSPEGRGCPFCGDRLTGERVRFGYRMGCCQACGSVACLDEVPDEVVAALYGDPGYYSGGCAPYGYDGDVRHYDAQKTPVWQERLAAIAALQRGRRLLEVGPGTGGFARLASASGWDVMAVDPYPAGELEVPVVPTLELAAATGRFDAVCLFDVIEHLAEPLGLLRQLPPLLVQGGCVAIASPNAGGGSFRSVGFDWWEVRPPEHLSIPSDAGMVAALERSDLQLVRTVGHFTQTWHWPPVMLRLLAPTMTARPLGRGRQLGLRAVDAVTRRLRARLPHPRPERQDYVTWLARPRLEQTSDGTSPSGGSGPPPVG